MNNPGATGLGSLQQHGVAIPGETKNIAYFFNLAKKMSDGQLADVLAGKSLNVPQFVAMTEAMGRKQLRQAVDGAQAMQQAKQPSVKDQLMAENAGLASLPAQNLENLGEGHAAGGIIAFEDGGKVQHFYDQGLVDAQQKQDQEDLLDTAKKLGLSAADILTMVPRAGAGILNAGPIRSLRATGLNIPYIPDVADGDFSSKTPFYDKYVRNANKKPATPSTADTLAFTDTSGINPPSPTQAAPSTDGKGAGNKGDGTKGDGSKGDGSKGDGGTPLDFTFNPRKSRMEGLKAEAVDYNKLKEQGFGEGLMKMAAGFMSKPTLAGGASEGLKALAESGAATRKEIAGLKKDARDYDLLVAKANDAFDQGNDELGMKYKTLAETSKYHDIMGRAALMTAGAHQTTAAAASEKPDMQLFKLTQEALTNRLKTDIQFKNKFNQLSADDQMAYLKNMYQQNKAMYTGVNSPGGSPSAAPVKFLGFEPNANS